MSCFDDMEDQNSPDSDGTISISLSIDQSTGDVDVQTGRIDELSIDELTVTVFDASDNEQIRFFPDGSTIEPFSVNPGTYYAEASNNETSSFGFEAPKFFAESQQVTITSNNSGTIVLNAEQTNSKVSVSYDPQIAEFFSTYSTEVMSPSGSLSFNESETREGYFDAGVDLSINVTMGDLTASAEISSVEAKTHYTIQVNYIPEPNGSGSIEIIIDDSTNDQEVNIELTGSIQDGIYLLKDNGNEDYELTLLNPLKVGAPNFTTEDRAGHAGKFTYLNDGEYFFIEVESGAAVTSYSGVAVLENDPVYGTEYQLINLRNNKEAFSIDSDGMYYIAVDLQSREAVIMKVFSVGILGSGIYGDDLCDPIGFGVDIDLDDVSVNDDALVFKSSSGITMKDGEYKVRINDTWEISRPEYTMMTNYGGVTDGSTTDKLEEGGLNLSVTEDGVFDIIFEVLPSGETTLSLIKTGDAGECEFRVEDFNWGILGSAIDPDDADQSGGQDGWEYPDQDMFYQPNDTEPYTWLVVVGMESASDFWKLRTNNEWNYNLGIAGGSSIPTDGSFVPLTVSGEDIPSLGTGQFYIILRTLDEGQTWEISARPVGWGILGTATPTGWDNDTDMTFEETVQGVTSYTINIDMTEGEYKVRAGDEWLYNYGAPEEDMIQGGENLVISEAGNYTFRLQYFDGTHSLTYTKN